MMGSKARVFRPLSAVTLNELLSGDRVFQHLERRSRSDTG